jgi:hypothetical protein
MAVSYDWKVRGVGDFNGDGRADILWRNDNGQVAIWYMDGAIRAGDVLTGGIDPSHAWDIQGIADFNGDQQADILWRSVDGVLGMWFSGLYENGPVFPAWGNIAGANATLDWHVQGEGDFSGDGLADIFWRNDNGSTAVWKMDGGTFLY